MHPQKLASNHGTDSPALDIHRYLSRALTLARRALQLGRGQLQAQRMMPLLHEYVMCAFPEIEAPKVSNLRVNNRGWENETYSFTFSYGPAQRRTSEDLVLCIYAGAFAQKRASNEYQALTKLHKVGYPVPKVKQYAPDGARLSQGKPFGLVERVGGGRMGKLLLKARKPERERLLATFCGLFARLHSLDWRTLVEDPASYQVIEPSRIVEHYLAGERQQAENTMPPGFKAGWQWILAQGSQITSPGLSLVHFDFHPNNIILCPDLNPANDGAVVIDWSGATLTDYRFDLAWTRLLLTLNMKDDIGALLLPEYERQSGRKVADLEYFEATICFAWLLRTCMAKRQGAEQVGLRSGADKTLYARPKIRRVYERYRTLTGISLPEVEGILNKTAT